MVSLDLVRADHGPGYETFRVYAGTYFIGYVDKFRDGFTAEEWTGRRVVSVRRSRLASKRGKRVLSAVFGQFDTITINREGK